MARPPQNWQRFREFDLFGETFDELFDRFLGRPAESSESGRRAPAIESFIEDDQLIVRADLPGIDPAQLEVTINGTVLTIKGTRQARKEERQRSFIHREVAYGGFERSLALPYPVKVDKIGATYQNGVLELIMPRATEATPRKIAIEIQNRWGGPPAASSATKNRP